MLKFLSYTCHVSPPFMQLDFEASKHLEESLFYMQSRINAQCHFETQYINSHSPIYYVDCIVSTCVAFNRCYCVISDANRYTCS